MNERIRELQSKSYLMCKQIVDDDGHVVVTPDMWFDKFAELLVRECASIAATAEPWRSDDLILRHFGVEE